MPNTHLEAQLNLHQCRLQACLLCAKCSTPSVIYILAPGWKLWQPQIPGWDRIFFYALFLSFEFCKAKTCSVFKDCAAPGWDVVAATTLRLGRFFVSRLLLIL